MRDTEACEVCGFRWAAVGPDELVPRLSDAITGFERALGNDTSLVLCRPEPERWSALEYGAHVRDVLLNMRDRIFVGLAEDDPVTKPMYRDLRIPFYTTESKADVSRELAMAGALFNRTVRNLTKQQLERTLVAGYPRQTSRSLLWIASQALHESAHYLNDAQENVGLLTERARHDGDQAQ